MTSELVLAVALVAANLLGLALLFSRLDAIIERQARREQIEAQLFQEISKMYRDMQDALWRAGVGVNPRKKDGQVVYFIVDDAAQAIKIGIASDPERRLRELQTSHHAPLRIVATMPGGPSAEMELHEQFAGLRMTGEWFVADDSLMTFIRVYGDPYPAKKAV